MGILSDEQVKRIRDIVHRPQPEQTAARLAEAVKASQRADWRESLRQRCAAFYQSSLDRGLEWTLEFDHALVLLSGPCHYCGILEPDRFNGLDRVDNSKGYSLENVVTCCRWCNRAKAQNDVAEFLIWLEWVKGSKVREYLGSSLPL